MSECNFVSAFYEPQETFMSGSKVWFVTGAARGFGRLWEVYADRIKTWDAWEDVSKAAQGVPA